MEPAVGAKILFFQQHFISAEKINIEVNYEVPFMDIRNIAFLKNCQDTLSIRVCQMADITQPPKLVLIWEKSVYKSTFSVRTKT